MMITCKTTLLATILFIPLVIFTQDIAEGTIRIIHYPGGLECYQDPNNKCVKSFLNLNKEYKEEIFYIFSKRYLEIDKPFEAFSLFEKLKINKCEIFDYALLDMMIAHELDNKSRFDSINDCINPIKPHQYGDLANFFIENDIEEVKAIKYFKYYIKNSDHLTFNNIDEYVHLLDEDDALAICDRLISHNLEQISLFTKNDYEEERTASRVLFNIKSELAKTYALKSNIQFKFGKFDESYNMILKAIKLDNQNLDYATQLISYYNMRQDGNFEINCSNLKQLITHQDKSLSNAATVLYNYVCK